jgi:hypothetical protein
MPLTNLPTPVAYLLQSYRPSRPVIIKDGKRIRSRVKQRIAEPYLSMFLLFLAKSGRRTLIMKASVGSHLVRSTVSGQQP